MNRVKKTVKNTKKKHFGKAIRFTALLLITALVFSFLPSFSGKAASNYLAISSPEGKPLKREVIYGKLAADGSSQSIYVVNHYELSEMQSFSDYGDYSKVLQLTGDSVPQLDSGVVKLQATAGSYYYQGNLESTDLPWLIDITYELDGQKITAAQAAGAGGELLIKMSITANPAIDSFFFDNYALQVSATLNPDKARLLETNDSATVAISGEDRQVNWIVLPGQEADLFLRLQADNFEMDAITIAGIGLDFDFDLDISELSDETEGLTDLSDGIRQLADGTEELEAAIAQLQEAFAEIEDGSAALADNGSQLSAGAGSLESGSAQLGQGMAEYSGGVTSIKNGMAGLTSGLSQLRGGVALLSDNGTALSSGSGEILGALQQIAQGISDDPVLGGMNFDMFSQEQIDQLDQLLAGSATIKTSLEQIAAGTAGISDLYAGMQSFQTSLAGMESQLKQIPLLQDSDITIRDQAAWQTYLTDLGVAPEAQAKLIPELTALTTTAATYSKAIQELQGALARLNDSVTGFPSMVSGVEQLQQLAGGITELAVNYGNIHSGLTLLVNQLKGLAAMEGKLPELMSGLSDLKTGINLLVSEYTAFDSGLSEYTGGVAQLLPIFDGTSEQAGLLAGASQLQAGLTELDGGSAGLTAGLNQLSAGAADYRKGIDSYVEGVSSLNLGLTKFSSEGLAQFASGFASYADGANEFREATANLEDDFLEQMEAAIAEFTDMDFEPRSFVSEKNENVAGVQFVLMTEAISMPADNNGSSFAPEVEGNFLSRLRSLFVKDEA